jgi:sec-independent protein translocase protein TatC
MKPLSTKDLDLYEKDDNVGELAPLTIHLDELRNKIIISLIAFCIATILSFSFSKEVIRLLTNISPSDTIFIQIRPGEFFFSCIRISLYFGIVLSSPVIIWQLGSFILPGLKPHEKKIALPILIGAPFLFLAGSIFAYYFIAPSMLNFLFGFGESVISTSISIENFISFTLSIMAMCGLTFLLPVVIFALASVGIIDTKILISSWRYAIFGSVVLGAILTPTPDPFNMSIISGLLITLYFLSYGLLLICKK